MICRSWRIGPFIIQKGTHDPVLTLVVPKKVFGSARVCTAARGKAVLEFGLRRAQGPDGALSAARAAYIGGASATSNVYAAHELGIPASGTMAHSWVMSFDDERTAFRRFAALYPDSAILLIDTYDTLGSGIENAISVFDEMRGKLERYGVRIDSGNLVELSVAVRNNVDVSE